WIDGRQRRAPVGNSPAGEVADATPLLGAGRRHGTALVPPTAVGCAAFDDDLDGRIVGEVAAQRLVQPRSERMRDDAVRDGTPRRPVLSPVRHPFLPAPDGRASEGGCATRPGPAL